MMEYRDARLLCVHVTESDRFRGKPLYEAIVDRCRELKIAGATVYRALEGFGGSAQIHRPHLLARDLPVAIEIVDSEENIGRILPLIEEMMEQGCITIAEVRSLRVEKASR